MLSKIILVLCSLAVCLAKPNDLNSLHHHHHHDHHKEIRRPERNPQYGGGGGGYAFSSPQPSTVTGYSYTTPGSLQQNYVAPISIQTQFPSFPQQTTSPPSIVAQPQQVYSLPQSGEQPVPQQTYFPPPLGASQQQQTFTTPQTVSNSVTTQSVPQSTNFPSNFWMTQQSQTYTVPQSVGINYGAPTAPPQTSFPPNNNNNPSVITSAPNQKGMPFNFQYNVNDGSSGNQHSHDSKSDGNTVTGSYKTLLPDGRTQVVSYTAGQDGYNAVVTYEGTSNVAQGNSNTGSGQQGSIQPTGTSNVAQGNPNTGSGQQGFIQPTGTSNVAQGNPNTGSGQQGFIQSTGQQGTGFNQPSSIYQPPSF